MTAPERALDEAAMVRGRHYAEWRTAFDELKRRGPSDEYIALLRECISATELEACAWKATWGVSPPTPARYTLELAEAYRKRGQLHLEIGVLEQYLAVPGNEGKGGAVARRLANARRVAAQSSSPNAKVPDPGDAP